MSALSCAIVIAGTTCMLDLAPLPRDATTLKTSVDDARATIACASATPTTGARFRAISGEPGWLPSFFFSLSDFVRSFAQLRT